MEMINKSNIKKELLLIVLLILIIIFSYYSLSFFYKKKIISEKSDLTTCEYTLYTYTPSDSVIEIKNTSKNQKKLYIELNGNNFYSNIAEILIDVNKVRADNAELKIFNYISQNTSNGSPYSNEYWMHTPWLFLNSLGFGICDDKASLFYHLANESGIEVRVHSLSGHVVTEVFNKKWEMYDADRALYFLNKDGDVASVSELSNNSELIHNPVKSENVIFADLDNSYLKIYSDNFTTKDDNIISTDWYDKKIDIPDSVFVLPSNSKLLFFNKFNSPLLAADGNKIENYTNLKIIYPENYKGIINNFLVIQSISGDGIVKINKNNYEISSTDFFELINNRKTFINNLEIVSSKSDIEVIYLVNPRRFRIESFNKLQIRGDKCMELDVNFLHI